jgi:hypothetical protein
MPVYGTSGSRWAHTISVMRTETVIDATFHPNDGQPSWTGQLRQTIITRVLEAGAETMEALSSVEWDRPNPLVDYFPTATGTLEIVGEPPCAVWWGNGQFNHSGGFRDE